jgi:hypothetical protein
MRATIVFVTGRDEPHLDWVVADLLAQIQAGDELQLVVIDALGRTPAQFGIADHVARFSHVIVSPPKPTIWQGAHRITKVDWWANSNARNTGMVLCRNDFVAFLDDRCHLGSRWLEAVRRAERKRSFVLAGSYEKNENGAIVADHRRVKYPDGKRNCGGGWLFGCAFALPLQWCLDVNGMEEGCDGLSFEDCIFGHMLENQGHRIDFEPKMFVSQERSKTHTNRYMRSDRGIPPRDKSHAALERFGKRKRTEFTPDLTAMRAAIARGEPFPIPDPKADYRDWFDGASIREFTDGVAGDTASFSSASSSTTASAR